jgi:hypothetical protein
VYLAFHLNEPAGLAAPVAAQRFGDQRQPDPFVRLPAAHGAVSQKNKMASFAWRIVQELHQIDAVPRYPVSDGSRVRQFFARGTIPVYCAAIVQVEVAERVEILRPLVNQIRRNHDNHRTPRAEYGEAVRDRQRDERFAHADLVGQDHTRLAAQPPQDLFDFGSLTLLIRFRDPRVESRPQDKFGRRMIDVAHDRHSSNTRSQKSMTCGDTRPRLASVC